MKNIYKLILLTLTSLSTALTSCGNIDYSFKSNDSESSVISISTSESQSSSESKVSSDSSSYTSLNKFEGLIFNDLTVEYDGQTHTILVENLPNFATATYKNNSKQGVGTYNASATVSATGYETVTLYATLKITAKEFSGITFKDQSIPYDGYYHSIYVEGAPETATVTYTNNNKCEVGTYKVTATIKQTGYQTLTLSATMKIGKFFNSSCITLDDRTLFYTGDEQRITYGYNSNLIPYYSDYVYYIDGKEVTEDNFKVKTVGEHTAKIKLTNSKYSYEDGVWTATIKVVENKVGGVDSSKEAFKFSNNTKYQTLRSEILKGNFTVKVETGNDKIYHEGGNEYSTYGTTYTYVTDGEAFEFFDLFDKSEANPVYETYYNHYKIVNNDVVVGKYENGVLVDKYKMPKSAYEENVIAPHGLVVLAYLSETNTGEITSGSVGGYTTTYGTCLIDTINNSFSVETRNHYYHTEFDHDEVMKYTIYNIGNTKINMESSIDVSKMDIDKIEYGDYCVGGVSYYTWNNSVKANISIDAIDFVYLEKKAYVLLPTLNGNPIKEIGYEYYDSSYDLDLTGLELDVYFNDEGYYQGEYESQGYVKYYGDIVKHFANFGGTVKYYGEW